MTQRRTAVLLAALAPLLLAVPADASDGSRSTTRGSMVLTVSPASGLPPSGRTVRVTGRGYDDSRGIYVAFCVDNGQGQRPTPCGGGQDREGTSGSSVWISSFPPYYGTGLAQPYGEGGTFDVTIHVEAQLDDSTDCRKVRCAVVTRSDHTNAEDRSLDVAVPVTFAQPASASPRPATAGASRPATPEQSAPQRVSARSPAPEATASSVPSRSPEPVAAADPVTGQPAADLAAGEPPATGERSSRAPWLAGAALLAAAGAAAAAALRARRARE